MSKIKKILIPVDFTEISENALKYLNGLIDNDDTTEIVLLHVTEAKLSEEKQKEAEAAFHQLAKRVLSSLTASYSFQQKSGELVPAILAAQAETGADLILIGTKGSEMVEEQATSNTANLVLEANVPVLVVPEEASFAMNNIALALDKNEIDDFFLLSPLHAIARKFDAAVHVLTIQTDKNQVASHGENAGLLEYYLETLDHHCAFPQNTDIELGISDYVAENNIDLLVMLPRVHATTGVPSEGRLIKLLTLRTKVPLLSLD
ncbi:universal stress protein [Tunicatimonas pelagia]|uniref:universal stress protein n=1 Tax=Tunicatimonas pelagia TaxID=931531 RepID=UPI002665EA05|nr:universal stress protein [Tunicatimonas pelagia]WKN42529.1 universal stress protein [Tunicatimonas pelagia]